MNDSAVSKSEAVRAEDLKQLADAILKQAKQQGASACEVASSVDVGFTVSVRMGEVETVEYHRDKGMAVTVYMGQRKGSASTSDTSLDAIKETVEAACNIARYTGEDPYAGLADKNRMAFDYPDLALNHPWQINVEEAIEKALACETMAREKEKRITNSEAANVTPHQSLRVYGNSHGFIGAYPSTQHSLSCILIASENDKMQADYGYTIARDPKDLMSIETVANDATHRTTRRLGGKPISTRQAPVIFAAEIAGGLLGHFVTAIQGGNLYRKTTFLLDHLGKPLFSKGIHICERPHLLKGLGSAPFDAEGVKTAEHDLIEDGILKSYVLGSYSARKLGMTSTGNAGGVHNVTINTSDKSFDGLLKQMNTGLLVTEVMGQGVNIVTGDYSRGAAGFWVENGEIQYPVEEITIAGNLRDMFANLVCVANDVDHRSNMISGSILLEEMTIAGN